MNFLKSNATKTRISSNWVDELSVWLLAGLLIFTTILLTFLASRYSLWGDEFDTIMPAFRPWSGEKSFLWQIKQYNANPPGDNLVHRILFRTEFLGWMRDLSWEVFWRIPSLVVYGLTLFSNWWMGRRWSGSSLIGWVVLALFISIPATMGYGVEARFYSWAVFFMTLVVWQSMMTIENSFKTSALVGLSVLTSLGICFHVALVLHAYFLMLVAILIAWDIGLKYFSSKATLDKRNLLRKAWIIAVCVFPYFLFKYEKHHWIFLPGAGIKGISLALVQHAREATLEIPARLSENFHYAWFWNPYGLIILCSALLGRIAYDYKRKRHTDLRLGIYFLFFFVGGALTLFAGSKSANYVAGARNYLFEIPVMIALGVFLIFGSAREVVQKLPSFAQAVLIFGLFIFSCNQVVSYGHRFASEGWGKVNIPLAQFKNFYTQLPDHRPLVAVGVGDGDLWATTDSGGYLGGAHLQYLEALKPLYLSSRKAPNWRTPAKKSDWANFDFIVFDPINAQFKKTFEFIPWNQLSCFRYSFGDLSFCRKNGKL